MTIPSGAANLVIFDCDGVLVDSEALSMQVLVETMHGLGIEATPADCYRDFLGRGMASFTSVLHDQYGRELSDADLAAMRERLFELYRQELKPVPGVAEALSKLDALVCVASSSQPDRIRLSLELTGLDGFFGDHIFSATMVAHGKPAPDLFLLAAHQMGAAPQNCIVIEDSPAGIEAAARAAMRSLAFVGASHAKAAGLRETVARLNPYRIFERMDQLPALLANLEED